MSDIVFDSKVLCLLLVAAGAGALGGLARYFRDDAAARKGTFLRSVLLGATAAVAALYLLEPRTALKLIAMGIAAGYAGPTVLDALETRVKLMLAEQKAARAIQIGEEAVQLAREAIDQPPPQPPEGPHTKSLVRGASASDLAERVNKLQSQLAIIKTGGVA